jgi:hypothetical protein
MDIDTGPRHQAPEETLTEAASEKPRRGRPPTFPNAMLAQMGGWLNQHTRRGKTNRMFALDGMKFMLGDDAFRPILDFEAAKQGVRGAVKLGVLTEIGRIMHELGDEAAIFAAKDIVREITERGLTSRGAERLLRGWRMWTKARTRGDAD